MGDNGQTKEQKLEAKKKKFEQNPGKFIDTDELIAGFIKLDDGRNAFLVNLAHKRTDFIEAKAELDFQLIKVLHIIDEKIAQENKIVMPKIGVNPFRRHK